MRKPRRPPDDREAIWNATTDDLMAIFSVGPMIDGKYLHWDDIRHRAAPESLTHDQWWAGIKQARRQLLQALPLADAEGKPFEVATPNEAQALLHEITQRASGVMGASEQVTNPDTRNQYLIRGLMEEGITSSMLEGAVTTRQQAKELLRTERPPLTMDERMVVNNYRAMQFIINEEHTPLAPEMVFELHRIITDGTLDNPDAAGRLRVADDGPVDVIDTRDNEILHTPPPVEQLPDRLEAMCRFANGETPDRFVHPVVRSILLHFWLAYDHPFVDGNGRTARALFYWSMLRQDYWLCQYISISRVILDAPIQYARAFLHTETDENDATYFLFHQLDVIQKSLDKLHDYINSKMRHRHSLEGRQQLRRHLNERQIDIVSHALQHPGNRYDIKQHQTAHGITYQTARTDLLGLVAQGLFHKHKIGRAFCFLAVTNIGDIVDMMASGDSWQE